VAHSPPCNAHPDSHGVSVWNIFALLAAIAVALTIVAEEERMPGWFQRPKLETSFTATHAHSDEFARTIELAGDLALRNEGSEAELGEIEMMVIAGFRRIPLTVPGDWQGFRLASGAAKTGAVRWSMTLDAPLRAEAGELYVSVRDHKRKKWEWRLPFAFERR
jgi:hypothetical protein